MGHVKAVHTLQSKNGLCARCIASITFWHPENDDDGEYDNSMTSLYREHQCTICTFFVDALRVSFTHSTFTDCADVNLEYCLTKDHARPWLTNMRAVQLVTEKRPEYSPNILQVDFGPLVLPPRPNARLMDTDSIDFKILRDWISFCQEHHSDDCNRITEQMTPHQLGIHVVDCLKDEVILPPTDF